MTLATCPRRHAALNQLVYVLHLLLPSAQQQKNATVDMLVEIGH